MSQEKGRAQGVVGGVLILTLASLLVKVIGVFYKIPLSYILGDEGMGYFNAAYTIYAWLYMLSTAGLPVALSIMISEARVRGDDGQARGVVRMSAVALLLIGIATTAAMMAFSAPLARLLGTEDARYTIFAIAPTLFFICLSSLFRGIFQGHQNMVPTAVSQLIEAMGKVTLGMLLAFYARSRGYPLAVISAYAVFGVTLGTALGAVFLAIRYLCARAKGHLVYTGKSPAQVRGCHYGRKILAIALPVTVSASVMSLTSLIDLGMIIRRLVSIGYTQAEATALYGNYTTLVVPVFNLPSVVVAPIAVGIIPAVSAAFASGDREACDRMLHGAFKAVGMIAMPCAVGLCVFSRPVLALLYPAASVNSAYRLLTCISPAVFFLCALSVANAALQACGKPRVPMVSMLIGGAAKVVCGYFLLGKIGILGSPVGTLICYVIALTVDLAVIALRIGYTPSMEHLLWRPLLNSVISIGIAGIFYYYVIVSYSPRIGALAAILLAGGLYAAVSLLTGSVTRSELRALLRKGRRNTG